MSKKADRAKDPADDGQAPPTPAPRYDSLPVLPGHNPDSADGVHVGESPEPGIH